MSGCESLVKHTPKAARQRIFQNARNQASGKMMCTMRWEIGF
jgi:hypothetical protein